MPKIWKLLFISVFLWGMVDGFITNYLYPAKLPLLYKDFLVAAVYFLFLSQEHVVRHLSEFRQELGLLIWGVMGMFILVCVGQIFNPNSPGMAIGLLGLKIFFYYWPLALLAFAYVDDVRSVMVFLQSVFYFSIPVNLFGLYQFSAGPEMLEGLGAGFQRAIVMTGEAGIRGEKFFRVLGTFASSGQYANFLLANAMFGFALLFYTKKIPERVILGGALGLNFVCMLATGSRGVLMLLVFQVALYAFLSQRARPIMVIAFISGLSLYGGFSFMGRGIIARYDSLRQIEMIHQRTIGYAPKMFMDVFEQYPMGKGLGSASTQSRYLPGAEGKAYMLVENYPSKIQAETGMVGVLLFYLMMGGLVVRFFNRWIASFHPYVRDIGLALSAYCLTTFTLLTLFGVIDNVPVALFIWTVLGMVMKLSWLSREEWQ